MSNLLRIAIVGGTGYTGAELLRLLAGHPQAQVVAVTSRQEAGKDVADTFPNLRGHYALSFVAPDMASLADQADVVFFATPHGAAMDGVAELLRRGVRVIDLSADFRLRDAQLWESWYGQTHTAPEFLDKAVYGLPELNRAAMVNAQLIACPGCYPTSVELALLPLLRHGCIETHGIVADCKSGVSGGGRQAKIGMLFCEAGDSISPYASAGHRHQPEIDQVLSKIAGTPVHCLFQPHLVPQIRGIESSIYAPLKSNSVDLQAVFEEAYRDEPFVDVMSAGSHPQTRSVRGTNMARIAVTERNGMAVVYCVIDNLARGSSAQAIQGMNIMFGLDQGLGLSAPALLP
ncbi:MAG: N-acetyl-gamma-glutamyl-phosphate reductase [Oceanococcus sp.]